MPFRRREQCFCFEPAPCARDAPGTGARTGFPLSLDAVRGGGMARFDGTESYIATDDLRVAVNAAIALERPLLVKGEPGTGKTILAHEIAKALASPLIAWH